MEEEKRIFGIDLGTTYSCIATIDEYGKPLVLKNSIGVNITPSVVFYESKEKVIVGETAKSALDSSRRVSFIKREIGNDNFVSKCIYPEDPVIVSSYILKKLVQDANKANKSTKDPIKDVVITCPAYFGTKEKMQTQQAGEIAGLNVLAILQEPTAAAIAYGLDVKKDSNILVYDLGGGTFDVTIINVSKSKIRTIATGGDSRLGGVDWDKEIVKYLANQYENETGESNILSNPETEINLYLLAETVKKRLTDLDSYKTTVNHNGRLISVELTKEVFESITSNLLNRTISIMQGVIDEAKEKRDKEGNVLFNGVFDEVLLVGGSSRMPMVKIAVDNTLKCDAQELDPDEVVAKGAAMFAMFRKEYEIYKEEEVKLTDDEKEKRGGRIDSEKNNTLGGTDIVNVVSYSYGIGSVKWEDENKRIISTMVFKQDDLPTKVCQIFKTAADKQTSMKIDVYECSATKEDKIKDNDGKEEFEYYGIPMDQGEFLNTATLNFGKPLPKSSPVEVTMNIDSQGMMDVTAIEKETGQHINIHFQLKGVRSKEEVAQAAVKVSRVDVES